MDEAPRITLQTLKVLRVLFSDLHGQHYGLEIAHAAGLKSGTLYPILARLERAGWVTSEWEDITTAGPLTHGRRPRRYYQLSPEGAERARHELRDAQALLSTRPARIPGSPAPGGSPA